MPFIVILSMVIVLISLFIYGVEMFNAVRIAWLSRKIRCHGFVLGMEVMVGKGGDQYDQDSAEALKLITAELQALGIQVGALHTRAAESLMDGYWRDGMANTTQGRADLIFVGDWRIWSPMSYLGGRHYTLTGLFYNSNGNHIPLSDNDIHIDLPLSTRRSHARTQRLLAQQGVLLILRGFAAILRMPATLPHYSYGRSQKHYTS